MKKVAIIMGSDSDLPVLKPAVKMLAELEIPFDVRVMSAHRTPAEAADFARNARAVQGTLLALENLATKIDWGRYYLAARKSYDQYYLETVGIPCGKIFSIHNRGVDLVRLTIGKFNAVL